MAFFFTLAFCSLCAFLIYKAYKLRTDITLSLSSLDKSYFKDRIVWITGASSGIGKALAFELSSYGSKLILSARSTDKLEAIKKEILCIGSRNEEDIMILPLDLSKTNVQKSIYETYYAQILDHFCGKSIDILINNAGIAQDSLSDEIAYNDIYNLFNVNLISPAIITRTVLPDMLQNGFGHIINISSVTSYFQNGAMNVYAASKNGLNSLSRVLSTEMDFIAPNVRCTLCILGAINTGIDQRIKNADGSIGSKGWQKWGSIDNGISPKECAKLICTAASNKLKEVWISKHPELSYLYATQQFPNLYARFPKIWMRLGFPPFIDLVNKRLGK